MAEFSEYLRLAGLPLQAHLATRNLAEEVALWLDMQGVSLIVYRAGEVLPPQTCLFLPLGSRRVGHETRSATSEVAESDALLIGVRGHPSLPDCDVQRGDVVTYNGAHYEVLDVQQSMAGKVEARLKARQ